MSRTTPALETRAAVLRAWSTVGTPSDILRRLRGASDRATVHSVQRWADMHGYLHARAPRGRVVSSAGLRWLDALDSGSDPDPVPTEYHRPRTAPQRRTKRPRGITRGSIPHAVLGDLATEGADCVAEISKRIGRTTSRGSNSCRMLQIAGYVTALGERRPVRGPHGWQSRVVLVSTITDAGRRALEVAR